MKIWPSLSASYNLFRHSLSEIVIVFCKVEDVFTSSLAFHKGIALLLKPNIMFLIITAEGNLQPICICSDYSGLCTSLNSGIGFLAGQLCPSMLLWIMNMHYFTEDSTSHLYQWYIQVPVASILHKFFLQG